MSSAQLYRPVHYMEEAFPPDARLDWQALAPLMSRAAHSLGDYSGALKSVPDSNVLLSPLARQEAVLSSRIEGTQATMEEVLRFEAGQEPDSSSRLDDIQEIINYRAALLQAHELLADQPLSQSVIKSVHQTLLSGVRGASLSPGQYRTEPNWIGLPGSTIETATYVPVPADKLAYAMDCWETYAVQDDHNPLIKMAVLHAEFEAIHPFLDGNGRLGRILIPLLTWKYDLIPVPMFYISAFLEANRRDYYEGLLAVSRDDDWTGWCRFFLHAVENQAKSNLAKVQGILSLFNTMKYKIHETSKSRYAVHVLDWIFEHPVFSIADLATKLEMPDWTARRILGKLRDEKILMELKTGRKHRPTIYIFTELLKIADDEHWS